MFCFRTATVLGEPAYLTNTLQNTTAFTQTAHNSLRSSHKYVKGVMKRAVTVQIKIIHHGCRLKRI